MRLDVPQNVLRRGGGKGAPDGLWEVRLQLANQLKIRSKIMPPLGNAMRLVHHDRPDIPKPMTGEEQGMSNALRRHVQKMGTPKPDIVQHAVSVSAHPGFRPNAPRPELVALVLHKRHQRCDHNAQSTTRQGGKLETHAFASTCGHQGEHVFSKGQVVSWFDLMWPERVVSPMRLQ